MKQFSSIINNSFSYLELYANFIAGQIMLKGRNDPATIASILLDIKEITEKSRPDFLTHILFDFVDPKGYLIASCTDGIITEQIHITAKRRKWVDLAPKQPWKMHIAKPDIGITKDKEGQVPVISVGYGVTNRYDKFIGIVTTGLTVSSLRNDLQKELGLEDYEFLVLDQNFDFILHSNEKFEYSKKDKSELKNKVDYISYEKKENGVLRESLIFKGTNYIFYGKSKKYPFIILIGIKRDIYNTKDLERKILELEKENKYSQLFLTSLIYLFQNKIINPIIKNTSIKNKAFELPKIFSSEINDLFFQLEHIQNYSELKNEKNLAERLFEAKSLFFANLNHELRTPLNAILGASQDVLSDHEAKKNSIENAEIIYEAGEHLLELVNNILEMSKLEQGKTVLCEENFDLEDVIDLCCKMLKLKANDKKIRILFKPKYEIPWLFADKQKIRQIILNLLSNAIKFTNDNGFIKIEIEFINKFETKLLVKIIDSGKGIKKEDLQVVLEEYGQTKEGIKRNDSTGLGLPLSKKMMELHNGSLQLDSKYGVGTTIVLEFPMERLKKAPVRKSKEYKEARQEIKEIFCKYPEKKIMIVDDVVPNLIILRKLLQRFITKNVIEIFDGNEVITKAINEKPDLVFMDINLNDGISGVDLIKKLKPIQELKRTKFIMLTADSFNKEKIQLETGCEDFVEKPYKFEKLVEVIDKQFQG